MRSKLEDMIYDDQRNLPNRFTEAVGKLIRKARLEAKMSQGDLAERAYLKQSSVSKIESGNRFVTMEDLDYISVALNKPISYFFPEEYTSNGNVEESSTLEEELLIQARRLNKDDLRKLIAQVRGLADFKK